ncbi:hypothetical protein FN846DRAFT_197091, partial [Sphaerosporella brunnea]
VGSLRTHPWAAGGAGDHHQLVDRKKEKKRKYCFIETVYISPHFLSLQVFLFIQRHQLLLLLILSCSSVDRLDTSKNTSFHNRSPPSASKAPTHQLNPTKQKKNKNNAIHRLPPPPGRSLRGNRSIGAHCPDNHLRRRREPLHVWGQRGYSSIHQHWRRPVASCLVVMLYLRCFGIVVVPLRPRIQEQLPSACFFFFFFVLRDCILERAQSTRL